jgi:dTDP-4-amino-4,6-dideoxygalactose transaminase
MNLKDFKIPNEIPANVFGKVKLLLEKGNLFRYIDDESEVTKLEKDFAKEMGVKYALAVNSCSSAIFLSLLSLGIKSGDRVLIPAFTFSAVPSAVRHAGAVPVLVEINNDYTVDSKDFGKKIKDNIKAVVISHMRGHVSDMDIIMSLCKKHKIPLIEDAAHSLGSFWKDKKSGTLGDIGCFSFQSYKLLNSGEGGILITSNKDVIAKTLILSGAYENNWEKHGIEIGKTIRKYKNKLPAYNLRLNNLSALIVRSQLPLIDRRAKLGLKKINLLKSLINNNEYISVPNEDPRVTYAPDSLQFNLLNFSNREAFDLIKKIRDKGVSFHILGLEEDNARAFWNWKFLNYSFKLSKTRRIIMRTCDLRVPLHFSDDKIKKIANIIIESIYEIRK